MIFRFLIAFVPLIIVMIMIYKVLEKPKKVREPSKFMTLINKPFFKIPIGIIISLISILLALRFAKVLPLVGKIAVIGLEFTIIYLVVNYLIINKQK
jgi:hypothetical protein